MARLHVHTGLKVGLQLRFTELVNLLDEMTNVANENIKYISLKSLCYRMQNSDKQLKQKEMS